jgi:Na+/H+ antiporter NhaD/arsenite permease-like protein
MSRKSSVACVAAAVVLAAARAAGAETGHEGPPLGYTLPVWSVLPFVGMLLSIALFPLFAPHFWHRHYPKVTAFWGIILAVPFLAAYRGLGVDALLHTYLLEYIPFIILLWALFTVAGGIHLKGAMIGTPRLNTLLLAIGTAIASWMGTTGAAMILIRTVLRANKWRKHKAHVIVFFIFLVANVGGALTPLGDPPLFLGFLVGVPFFWTMKLLPHMLLVAVPLLAIFFAMDTYYYKKDAKPKATAKTPLRIEGAHNLLFLAGILAAVLASGMWRPGSVTILGVHEEIQNLGRDGALVLLGIGSLLTTKKAIRAGNDFTWGPIREVAILFAGIFTTIVPALAILKAGENGALGGVMRTLESPAHYFWITGSLSSFLDNAPSYLTFLSSALGKFFSDLPALQGVHELIANKSAYLEGISLGAVLFGANTYIGNAPNFMVKSIAEEAGVRMPSFFGYMFKYSIPILLPLFFVVTLVFF